MVRLMRGITVALLIGLLGWGYVLAADSVRTVSSRQSVEEGKEPPFVSPTKLASFIRYVSEGKIPPTAYKVRITDVTATKWEKVKVWVSDEEKTTLTFTKIGDYSVTDEWVVFVPDPVGANGPAYRLARTYTLEGKTVKVHVYHAAQWNVSMLASYLGGAGPVDLAIVRRPFFFFEPLDDFNAQLTTEIRVSAENTFFGLGMLIGYGGFEVAIPPKENPEFEVAWKVVSGPATIAIELDKTASYITSAKVGIDPVRLDPIQVEAELKAFKLPHPQAKEFRLPDLRTTVANWKYSFPPIQPVSGRPANLAMVLERPSYLPGESAVAHVLVTDSQGRVVEDGTVVDVELSGDGTFVSTDHVTVNGRVDIIVLTDLGPWDTPGAFILEAVAASGSARNRVTASVGSDDGCCGPDGSCC